MQSLTWAPKQQWAASTSHTHSAHFTFVRHKGSKTHVGEKKSILDVAILHHKAFYTNTSYLDHQVYISDNANPH
jgi:hypothetical protein